MPKRQHFSTAFTLIEVMVAVMIVSVVIAALLQMQGNAAHKFLQIKKMMDNSQYSSFLLSNSQKYGFERSRTDVKSLLDDFELESDLRRNLASIKLNIEYEELNVIDTNEMLGLFEDEESEVDEPKSGNSGSSGVVFEIGKTVLKSEEFTNTLIRVRLQ